MATIVRTNEGNWRAQVRRKGRYASQTFRLKSLASEWVTETERMIDIGYEPISRKTGTPKTISDLIDLHIADLQEVGKPIRRSKNAVLVALKRDIGSTRISSLNRSALIAFGKMRAKQGAGPVTLSVDLSYIHTVLTHAAAVHGINTRTEDLRLARVALSRLGLIGRSKERNRRPTEDEIDALLNYFDNKTNMIIPMGRVIRFAIATAMRLEEIFKIEWSDVDLKNRIVIVRNRKDPRHKDGNSQKVPLLNLTGFDAWQLLLEQKIITNGVGRVFPHHHKSAGTAFRRGRQKLEIEDLVFHDLRHEATSRFFEAGLSIEKVALVTGHKDWKMLKRYTHLRPEDLHRLQNTPQLSEEEHLQWLIANR
ncbi:site-specific integrase [Hoeflea prorocentri]|uniref:Site-specific integrase n=1 Tax=Hoeflea prorocentri TaxID=1922333 RepID=A0A9X3UJG6_9HYPH|nr:site-specific integrase [Hoeflea prorocentri]MCY6380239.1 site-specific integrase [Hoeflea prorocentri]MDA5398039.1 site-specific integrase [Hoeflea prorocentri]